MIDEKDELETQAIANSFGDGMSADHVENAKGTLKRFIKDLMKQKGKIAAVILSLAVSAIASILSPKVLGMAIDQLYNGMKSAAESGTQFLMSFRTMGDVLTVLIVLYLLNALFSYIPQRILASVAQEYTLGLRHRISEKLNRLPLKYYDTHRKGEILSRVTSDLERVADSLQETIAEMITAVITLSGAFIMMVLISPMLTLIALGSVIASIILTMIIGVYTNRFFSENQKALGELNANIEESFTGNKVIKAFNLQKEMTEKNDEVNEKLRKASTKAEFITYAINPVIRLVGQFGYVIIAVRGALSVINGKLSIGDVLAVFQYVNQISEPITQLSYTMNTLQGALASVERVYNLLDEIEMAPDSSSEKLIDNPKGNVEFSHVRFGYSDDNILMEDINIEVKAGSKVAVVGPTGAGKTTLINLLMRFYELQGGKICIDGVDIKDMSRNELRDILGMVLQDTWLFNGTVSENIAYGKDDAEMEEIVEAAETARVDHFIRTLPQGYNTVIDDELTGISAGQKQLLTIARVILTNPAILILDEATSSVDTRTEIEIQKAMNSLMKGRTSFIIAHRLSTIKDADTILVMRDGTIIEQGNHKELLDKDGFYADLYNSQFASSAV